MPNSNYYSLEITSDKNGKKFSALEYTSMLLKIISLLCLIILWRYFYIAIALWVLSIVVNFFKRNLIYKYVYTVADGTLTVEKVFSYEKKQILESIDLKQSEISLKETNNKYYEKRSELAMTVSCAKGEFTLDVDEYFYALCEHFSTEKR